MRGHDTDTETARLREVEASGLLWSERDPLFDQLTDLATRLLDAPTALLTVVARDHQFFKSESGAAEPMATQRGNPISYSFCAHAVASGETLVVEDARVHPLVADNPSVSEFGVIAYAGVPLKTPSGHALGSLCVIDSVPRQWTTDQLRTLETLAQSAMDLIARRFQRAMPAIHPLQRLWDLFDAHLQALEAYDALVEEGPDAHAPALEGHARGSVAQSRHALELALADVRGDLPAGAGDDLVRAIMLFLETAAERERMAVAFREGRLPLAEFEQVCVAAKAGEEAAHAAAARFADARSAAG